MSQYPKTFIKAGSPDLTVHDQYEENQAREGGYQPQIFAEDTQTMDPNTGRAKSFDPVTGEELTREKTMAAGRSHPHTTQPQPHQQPQPQPEPVYSQGERKSKPDTENKG